MKNAQAAIDRANALKYNMGFASNSRWRIRAMLDGGPDAIRALLGNMGNLGETDLPWANFIHSGITALAQKLGTLPEARVSPPVDTDNERPRKRAEKRERIVTAYDDYDRMELQLPQVGRWLPGYGFAVWTISSQVSPDGYVYPCAQLRDPYDAYPGEWGVRQQPEELAICRRIPPKEAQRLYPEYSAQIEKVAGGRSTYHSGYVLGSGTGWANQTGRGLEVVEYYDEDGTHILIPELNARVDHYPNIISSPPFVVAKRFAFNHLIGQYDHAFGPMAAHAKLSVLYVTAMQDNVFAPTNIAGDMDGQYKMGRKAVNRLAPNTKVDRPISNITYQAFEGLGNLERIIRNLIRYPVQDDGNSPLNFATGAGLEELQSGVSAEIAEYQKVFRYALQDLDAKRLEYDERVSPSTRKPLPGYKEGVPHVETYTPSKDIAGDYRTRREYGFMSGFDEPQKIVAGLQLIQGKLVDRRTVREKMSGLDELSLIEGRVQEDDAREYLMQGLAFAAQNGDPKAHMALIEFLPEGDLKQNMRHFYTPQDPQMTPEEEAMAGGGGLQEPPGDITTVLSRLTGSGSEGGVQTVGTLSR
jgi:hypothetical protein